MPQLLLTPRGSTGDPTPMVFLIHAARYLDHPEPGQLLRRHHPLFPWAGTDDLPSWRWQNSSEPDRSIYAALRAGDIPATGPLIEKLTRKKPTARRGKNSHGLVMANPDQHRRRTGPFGVVITWRGKDWTG
ncbi:hypothetical protein [Micromonospora sp. NPDC050200]|uniref:hypothetical protein n=1 Tax=Micromonospora sp. NPDC050200 TaxID=3155664 RepID=UPI00340539A8